MQNKKYKIQNTKYRIGNTKYRLKRASVAKKKVRRCSVEVARSRSEHCSSSFFQDSLDFSSESFQIRVRLHFQIFKTFSDATRTPQINQNITFSSIIQCAKDMQFCLYELPHMCFVCMCVGNVSMSICVCLDTAIYVQSVRHKDAIMCVLAAQYV